jgi:hypothetical protein
MQPHLQSTFSLLRAVVCTQIKYGPLVGIAYPVCLRGVSGSQDLNPGPSWNMILEVNLEMCL